MKFKNANRSGINKSKLQKLFTRMRDRSTSNEGSGLEDALTSLYNMFFSFFTNLGKPLFIVRKLRKGGDPNPEIYNAMLDEIKHDLTTCLDETAIAGDIVVETFNSNQIATNELARRANEAASKTIDLRLLAGQLDQEVVIAGDDFTTLDKVDLSFTLQNPAADIRPKEGIVTLKRVEAINLISPSVKVEVVPLAISGGGSPPSSIPTTTNTNRYYEGKFFGYIGQARPEGGQFHFEERISSDALAAASTSSEILQYDPADTGVTFGDMAGDLTTGMPIKQEDILIIDRGATTEEKRASQLSMVDNNPDTFWESEFVVDKTTEGGKTPLAAPDGSTPDTLRSIAIQNDEVNNLDLEIQITIELDDEVPVNWALLNPMNFGETAWLEITEVSTAKNEQNGFKPIEGFDQNRFANILTNEANEELQEDFVADTLAPSRFSFSGVAVYTFPVRTAKFVRFKVKQRVPVPAPYQLMAMQLNRTISSTKTVSSQKAPKSPGLCCFIFMEARYGDGTLDHVVRRYRDEFMDDKNRRGYYKLSEVLVPLMRKYRICKFLVRTCMTDPMVSYGKYYYGQNKYGWIFRPVTRFWLKLFKYLGGNHPFIRENGEVV